MNQRLRVRRPPRPHVIVTLLGAAALCSGCGSESPSAGDASPTPTQTASTSTSAVQARYVLTFPDDDSYRVIFDVVIAGEQHARVTMTVPSDDPVTVYRWTWDGRRILFYGNESDPPGYVLYEAPAEHRGDLRFVTQWIVNPEGDDFDRVCPKAQPLDTTQMIVGLEAVGFSCAPGRGQQSSTLWMDKGSGLLLGLTPSLRDQAEEGVLQAQEVTTDPEIDETTFSTDPPSGAEVEVIPAKTPADE